MRKATALILSTVLLLTAVFVAIPISASADTTPAPIKATPFEITYSTQWNLHSYVTASYTTPLYYTVAQGRSYALKTNSSFEVTGGLEGSSVTGEQVTINDAVNSTNKIPAADSHFMFYVETDGAETIYPRFNSDAGACYLRQNTKVQILQTNVVGATWEELDTVATEDNVVGSFGGYAIKLNSAFKGYIKIAYTDIGNATTAKLNSGTS